MRIALAGNPNSGKTTMFNSLTGRSEKVGNWAGVTVEKKEHRIKKRFAAGEELFAVDLPGAYSMSPFTSEESVAADYVRAEKPDVIINVVDATNLSRSLFFTTQLLELGIPVVIALNKSDVNRKKKNEIDSEMLSHLLGCPVVHTVSTASRGMAELVGVARGLIGTSQTAPFKQDTVDTESREAVKAADGERFEFVNRIIEKVERRATLSREKGISDTIDAVLTNKWFGLPIFAVVMFLVFMLSQSGPTVMFADFITGLLETAQGEISDAIGSGGIWASLLVDGIIGGFIAIVGFLPLVMVMYFLIALLEDCGYMARATVVLDPIFKRVGLSGKTVIPFIIGTGCSIPGIMACRAIRDEKERRAAAILTPFMPCGAKLPVISLFAGAFFGNSAWVGAAMYFVGLILIFFAALIVNRIMGLKSKKAFFIIELPEYKAPSVPKAALSMCQRGASYVAKAATVILVCNFAVHLMSNFGWDLKPAETASESILAGIARPFSYVIAPITGKIAWQLAAAVLTGFIAKENVVGTLAVCYGISNLFDLDSLSMADGAGGAVAAALGISGAAALAFLAFNLFSPPCFAAIGAMNSELGSKRWLGFGLFLQIAIGYSVGFLINFFGTLISGGKFEDPMLIIIGFRVVSVLFILIGFLMIRKGRVKKA